MIIWAIIKDQVTHTFEHDIDHKRVISLLDNTRFMQKVHT